MSIDVKITDATGTSIGAEVTGQNALKVLSIPETSKGLPPEDLSNLRLYRDFLKNAGSEDLNVDGSTTPVEFSIAAEEARTIWLTGVRFLFEGNNLEMNTQDFRRFGTATTSNTALTNGVLFRVEQSGETVNVVAEPIGIMGDFFSYADDYLNLINAVSSQSDFLYFDFDFDKPIVLAEGGSDKIFVTIQDDLTAIDKFQIIARGYQESV